MVVATRNPPAVVATSDSVFLARDTRIRGNSRLCGIHDHPEKIREGYGELGAVGYDNYSRSSAQASLAPWTERFVCPLVVHGRCRFGRAGNALRLVADENRVPLGRCLPLFAHRALAALDLIAVQHDQIYRNGQKTAPDRIQVRLWLMRGSV